MRRLRRSGKLIPRLMAIALFLFVGGVGLMTMTGCGTSNGFFSQTPQNYTVTMTASANNVQHASAVTLWRQGGGIDVPLAHHFAVRPIQADWIRTQFPNATTNVQNNLRLGAGVLLRFR